MMEKKIEFKKFEEIRKDYTYRFNSNRPIGQEWQWHDGFCTNGMGEGFKIHKGTDLNAINDLIDALNKRDVEIANLKLKLGKAESDNTDFKTASPKLKHS